MKQLPIVVAALLLIAAYASDGIGAPTAAPTAAAASPTRTSSGAASGALPASSEAVADDGAPRLPVALELPISPASSGATLTPEPEPDPEPDPEAVRELAGLRSRIAWLEMELVLCGSDEAAGPVADWLGVLLPEERPPTETMRLMVEYLRPYPVALDVNEGLWIAERITADDWLSYGPTVDEVLIQYLGGARLAAELTDAQLEPLLELWDEEGYFR